MNRVGVQVGKLEGAGTDRLCLGKNDRYPVGLSVVWTPPVDEAVLTDCGKGQGGVVVVTVGQAEDKSEKFLLLRSYSHSRHFTAQPCGFSTT